MLLPDGVYKWLQPLSSLVGRILSCGDLLARIFLPLYERQRSELCITR
jgi:hypothetical protein